MFKILKISMVAYHAEFHKGSNIIFHHTIKPNKNNDNTINTIK